MRIVALSGGVGGARFLRGLVEVADAVRLTIVGNVGDDVEVLGLHVSPDLDSVLYALTGRHDDERGWGARTRRGTRSRRSPSSAARRGSASATATSVCTSSARRRSARAAALSSVTARVAAALGLVPRLLPRRTTSSAPGWTPRRGRSRSRSGSWRAAIGTRSTA